MSSSSFQSKFCHQVIGKVHNLTWLVIWTFIVRPSRIRNLYIERTLRLQSTRTRNLVIRTTHISNQNEIDPSRLWFWLGTPLRRRSRHSTCPVYQTDRLNHTRLQTERPKARLGVVGILNTLNGMTLWYLPQPIASPSGYWYPFKDQHGDPFYSPNRKHVSVRVLGGRHTYLFLNRYWNI